MEWGTPVKWGRFILFCVPQSVKTKETNLTIPGSPTPCKQVLRTTYMSVTIIVRQSNNTMGSLICSCL